GEKALIAYVMAGDPSLQETEQLVVELAHAGADIIELGVPFSDPIADGPVIQQAAERALRSGTSLRTILSMVERLRTRTQIPLVLMAYYNSIHAFGPERMNTIIIGHQDQWDLGPGPEAFDHRKDRSKRCPAAQGSFCRLLDHGAVGDGIRKRHTQFNNISPGMC